MTALALALALRSGPAVHVRIDHVPNSIRVRAALTPRDVDIRATQTVESRDRAIVESIVHAIETTTKMPARSGADMRYGIHLIDERGTVTSVYVDAFGLRGVVDGRPVRFANDAIRRAIVAAYPQLGE